MVLFLFIVVSTLQSSEERPREPTLEKLRGIRAAETETLSHLSVRYDSQKSCKENCQASFPLRLTREVSPAPLCWVSPFAMIISGYGSQVPGIMVSDWYIIDRHTHSQHSLTDCENFRIRVVIYVVLPENPWCKWVSTLINLGVAGKWIAAVLKNDESFFCLWFPVFVQRFTLFLCVPKLHFVSPKYYLIFSLTFKNCYFLFYRPKHNWCLTLLHAGIFF